MPVIPTQITFRGVERSDALESAVRERVAWLEQFAPDIIRCRVLVEVPHRHHTDGRRFHVRVEMTVPGRPPIVVSHEPSSLHDALKDTDVPEHHKETETDSELRHARVAIHEAFDVARRQVQDVERERRAPFKRHRVPARGDVAQIFAKGGFGVIRSGDRRFHFSRESVMDDAFDTLVVGTPVDFVEEMGDNGPEASTVRVLGKDHDVEA